LPVVLYECEIWSSGINGRSLRVFENRVLRRIFGLKRDEIIGDGRILHKLYSLPTIPIIRMIKSNRMR
jgi:hypothetical protein